MAGSLDRTGKVVALGVFVALVLDGMDLQMLALALPGISKDFHLSTVTAGAQSMGWYIAATYTMMVIGKVLTGYLAELPGPPSRDSRGRVVQPRTHWIDHLAAADRHHPDDLLDWRRHRRARHRVRRLRARAGHVHH